MKLLLSTAFLLLSITLAHPVPQAQIRTADGTYYQLEPHELKAQIASKDFFLVNVHIPYEGEIAGTDAFIAFDAVSSAKNLPKNKKAEIVIYCRSGRMSQIAANQLVKMGYTNLRELKGGFDAWVAKGYQLTQRQR